MLDPCEVVQQAAEATGGPSGEAARSAGGSAVPVRPSLAGLAEPLIEALLDEFDEGLVVCDAESRPLLLNQAARAELATGDPLALDAGRLIACERGAADLLAADVREVAAGGRRRLLVLPVVAGRLFVVVLPMPHRGLPTGLAMVRIGRRALCRDAAIDLLAETHGLTASERHVLGGLVEGRNPSGIAAAKGVELSTVRTQISAIRGKLGTTSIDGLIRLAATLPSVVALPRARPGHRGGRSASIAAARAAWIAAPIAGPLAPRAAASAARAAVSTASAAVSAACSRAAGP